MTISHYNHVRFPITDGPSGTNSSDTTTGDRTFDHLGGPDVKGAVVVINSAATQAPVTGVLYGGVSMSLITQAVDTTEVGSVWIYALTETVPFPTGTQTVTLQGCTSDAKWATCSTVNASATNSTKVNASNFKNTTAAANPTLTVSTSAYTLLYGGMHGGAASPGSYVAGTNYTSQFNNDYGAKSARTERRTSQVAGGSIVYNFTYATSDDYCIAAVALQEFDVQVQPEGGSETITTVTPEGAGTTGRQGSAESITTTSVEGTGSPGHFGGADISVLAAVEGSGLTGRLGGSDTAITVLVEGAGFGTIPGPEGGSETSILALVEGAGLRTGLGASEAIAAILAEGAGSTGRQAGSTVSTGIVASGSGITGRRGSNETITTVTAEGAGLPAHQGSGQVSIEVTAEGAGTGQTPDPEGGSTALIVAYAEGGTGTRASSGGGLATVLAAPEGTGSRASFGGAEAATAVLVTGAGETGRVNGSTTAITVAATGGGYNAGRRTWERFDSWSGLSGTVGGSADIETMEGG